MNKPSEISLQRSAFLAKRVFLHSLKPESSKLKANRGFTLIETFVAIVILTTALAGALTLSSQGFNAADVAGDQITAAFLAQDALEYVQFVRDSTCLSGGCDSAGNWLSGLQPCLDSKGCYLDSSQPSNGNPRTCPDGGCPTMNFDPTYGFYNYVGTQSGQINNNSVDSGSNVPSKFTRSVFISRASGNDDEVHVEVRVSWAGRNGIIGTCVGSQRNCIILQKDLYNWQ